MGAQARSRGVTCAGGIGVGGGVVKDEARGKQHQQQQQQQHQRRGLAVAPRCASRHAPCAIRRRRRRRRPSSRACMRSRDDLYATGRGRADRGGPEGASHAKAACSLTTALSHTAHTGRRAGRQLVSRPKPVGRPQSLTHSLTHHPRSHSPAPAVAGSRIAVADVVPDTSAACHDKCRITARRHRNASARAGSRLLGPTCPLHSPAHYSTPPPTHTPPPPAHVTLSATVSHILTSPKKNITSRLSLCATLRCRPPFLGTPAASAARRRNASSSPATAAFSWLVDPTARRMTKRI